MTDHDLWRLFQANQSKVDSIKKNDKSRAIDFIDIEIERGGRRAGVRVGLPPPESYPRKKERGAAAADG